MGMWDLVWWVSKSVLKERGRSAQQKPHPCWFCYSSIVLLYQRPDTLCSAGLTTNSFRSNFMRSTTSKENKHGLNWINILGTRWSMPSFVGHQEWLQNHWLSICIHCIHPAVHYAGTMGRRWESFWECFSSSSSFESCNYWPSIKKKDKDHLLWCDERC